MFDNLFTDYDGFFFVGIGGVSMSALAKIVHARGKRVAGIDRCAGEYTSDLMNSGIPVEIGETADITPFQVVIYTDALAENHPLLIAARRQNKLIVSRGELLFEVSRLFKKTIAVAGCHGKTTCTSMLAHVFKTAELAFTSHIGGRDVELGNSYVSGFDYFLTEACEYKRNFLHLKSDISVILNSSADHLDCYGSVENLLGAYGQFAKNSKEVIKLYGDLPQVDGSTFGFDDRADYYAKGIRVAGDKIFFTVYEKGAELGRTCITAYGKHNVLNALACVAASRKIGLDFDVISAGLADFCGVKRRFEKVGTYNGATCIADYAHHPDELRAVIKTAKRMCGGDLYVIFQPHTYSRTKSFFRQFTSVLSQNKRLLIYKTFPAREYYDDAGSALTLSNAIKRSRYGDCLVDIANFLKNATVGDVVLVLGAGDVYEIFNGLVDD